MFLSNNEETKIPYEYKDTMPVDWDWKNGDVFIRYRNIIDENIYKQ